MAKRYWLISYALRRVGSPEWNPANDVSNASPAAWLIEALTKYYNSESSHELAFISAIEVTAAEAKKLGEFI